MEQRPDLPIIDIEKYGGKQVAILDGDVVAVGETLAELVQLAKQHPSQRPLKDFKFLVVPRSRFVLWSACVRAVSPDALRITEVLDSVGTR